EVGDVGLDIGRRDLRRRSRLAFEPPVSLQEPQESCIPPCKFVPAHLGKVVCSASWRETTAGSASRFPGTPIGVGPFAHRQRARPLEGGPAVRDVGAGHYSAASKSSSKCCMTILLKISLAWIFSSPI